MFDMFSLKSAMITASVFSTEGLNLLSFCPTAGNKGCFIVSIKYVQLIYFICQSGSKELTTLTLNYEFAPNLKTKFLKMTKDVIRW